MNIKNLFPILNQIPSDWFQIEEEPIVKINLKGLSELSKTKKWIIVKEGNDITTKFVSPNHTKLKPTQSNMLTPSTRSDDVKSPLGAFGNQTGAISRASIKTLARKT